MLSGTHHARAGPAMNLLILGRLAREFADLISKTTSELNISLAPDYGQEMRRAAAGAEIILGYIFPEELLQGATKLRWIQLMSAGADPVLFSPFLRDEVLITTARGVHSPQLAEYVLGVMVALARNFPQLVRNQKEHLWKQWAGTTLAGKTLGLVGFGALGAEIARLARAFSMRVIGLRRSGQPHPLADVIYPPEGLERLLSASDFVVLALPLTAETKGLIGPVQLGSMKRSAFLINISRGGVLDHEALISALENGELAGAALDVFEEEPLAEDSRLWETDNLFLTPHISGLSQEYVAKVTDIFLANLSRLKQGKPLINLVDKGRGY